MIHLVAIVGSNSKKSTNRQLLQYMQSRYQFEARIDLMEIGDLPLFNKPDRQHIPERVRELAHIIQQADGVIISAPEYDHSVPAALSNALAWLSYGPYPLVNKPVLITGASYGALGSSRAQAHLRQILDSPEIKARIMPSSEFLLGHSLQAFDEDGQLIDAKQVARLDQLFADFQIFIQLSHDLMQAQEEAGLRLGSDHQSKTN
ncbi:NADPH-dependent FMN reductase [Vaginisenegalia massiliensis]|uniref:NADPH-dependent FMN reductase n=1 Tax=Vaginisenegalia massiliensis TaxID=2058294 RepID=UPI000F52FE17|nr:NADPH-dependent FMN reductase [Vaginisenegalia massiliensis]